MSIATLVPLAITGCKQGILNPQGPVAAAEKTLLLNSVGIMLTIVVPVIVATLAVAWWFRAANRRARYRPTWAYSGKIEIVTWSIPAMVILLLGGTAWIGSHELDPARPLESSHAPLEVQVVALDWKWLFIYPRQGVASVNRLMIPADTAVSLKLTSATVMNSFFVPQLAGQIYTMAGMATQLNLLAEHPGRFTGSSAQFSGDGFSGMRFTVESVLPDEFAAWMTATQHNGPTLDAVGYTELAKPSQYVLPFTYRAIDPALFERIMAMKVASDTVTSAEQHAADAAAVRVSHTGSQ
jgi:cytochrome o ubiquinol oxidase subunit II